MKTGVSGVSPKSRPRKRTCTAPGSTPTRSSSDFNVIPVHKALPIAPLPHSPPGTRDDEKPRLLPEHWFTAASSTWSDRCRISLSVKSVGVRTWPSTRRRKVSTSIEFGITDGCQRTKNWSLGVKTLGRKPRRAFLAEGGRSRSRIISPFWGKRTSFRPPFSNGIWISFAANAGRFPPTIPPATTSAAIFKSFDVGTNPSHQPRTSSHSTIRFCPQPCSVYASWALLADEIAKPEVVAPISVTQV